MLPPNRKAYVVHVTRNDRAEIVVLAESADEANAAVAEDPERFVDFYAGLGGDLDVWASDAREYDGKPEYVVVDGEMIDADDARLDEILQRSDEHPSDDLTLPLFPGDR